MYNLIRKEFLNSIYNYRFIIIFSINVTFIVLSINVSIKNTERKKQEYENSVKEYNKISDGKINARFIAKGFRPPSQYSFLSKGFENVIPNEINITKEGINKITKQDKASYFIFMFGDIDIAYIMVNIVTILVIILGFDSISGERENGTIQLLFSNFLPKWKFLSAKILSLQAIILATLFVAFVVGLIILNYMGMNIFNISFGLKALLVIIVTFLFIMAVIGLVVLISVLCNKSSTSLIISLTVWCFFTILVPKISPIVAKFIYPIETNSHLMNSIEMVERNLENELREKEKVIVTNSLSTYNVNPISLMNADDPSNATFRNQTDGKLNYLRNEYDIKKSTAKNKILNNYKQKENQQNVCATILSRFSPISCYSLILSEIAQNGFSEKQNLENLANNFNSEVNQNIYSKFQFKRYLIGEFEISGFGLKDGVVYKQIKVPNMIYKEHSLTDSLKYILPCLIILLCYIIITFTLSYFILINKESVRVLL